MTCEPVSTVVIEGKCYIYLQNHHFAYENVPKQSSSGGKPTEDKANMMLEQLLKNKIGGK